MYFWHLCNTISLTKDQTDNKAVSAIFTVSTSSSEAQTITSQISWIKECLSTCLLHHEGCASLPPDHVLSGDTSIATKLLPTRLISVASRLDQVCLVETAELDHLADRRYASLSHCWGRKPFLTLRQQNYARFCANIPVDELGTTFREAIVLCQALNIPFIWIDSLCIVQDSREDWFVEAPRMHQVYGNSTLNITAAGSTECAGGLFRNHYQELADNLQIQLPKGPVLRENREIDIGLHRQYLKSPLMERGWIVQELILARRNIHWLDSHLLWQCKDGVLSSAVKRWTPATRGRWSSLGFGTDESQLGNRKAMDTMWLKVAETFAKSKLTMDEDRIIALSGLASYYASAYSMKDVRTKYIAGCWEHNILRGIAWYVLSPGDFYHESAVFIPSFSWLKMKNSWVTLTDYGDRDAECIASCICSSVSLSDPGSPFGLLDAATLELEAPVYDVEYSRWADPFMVGNITVHFSTKSITRQIINRPRNIAGKLYFDSKQTAEHFQGPNSIRCASLWTSPDVTGGVFNPDKGFYRTTALILKPIQTATSCFGDTNVYERIGLMQLYERGIRGSGNVPQSQFFDAETLDRQWQKFVLL